MDQREQDTTTSITLPPEVWLDILSRCSYFDLKRAQRVSKSFNDLIKTPRLDSILFRAQPDHSTLATKTRPLIHPILEELNLVSASLEDIVVHGDKKEYALTKLNVTAEMATSPPSRKVSVGGFGFGWASDIINEDGKGVTVEQVVRKIVDLWNEPAFSDAEVEDSELEEALEEALSRVDPSDKRAVGIAMREVLARYDVPTCLDALYENSDHVFFEGWEKPSFGDSGYINLHARRFGS